MSHEIRTPMNGVIGMAGNAVKFTNRGSVAISISLDARNDAGGF